MMCPMRRRIMTEHNIREAKLDEAGDIAALVRASPAAPAKLSFL